MTKHSAQFIVLKGPWWAAALLLTYASGCVSEGGRGLWQVAPAASAGSVASAAAERTVRETFPPEYRATQRAIITVRGRQYVCDGLLTASSADGLHLALISTLGLVTEVRVRPDGPAEVLKLTPLFPEDWARSYVGQDLRWLFEAPPKLAPIGHLGDGRLVLETASGVDGVKVRYACNADGNRWEELEVIKGPRRVFHARLSGYRNFPGCPRAIPAEIEVETDTHELQVRIAALTSGGATPIEGVR
jgi:hypothetical protein